MIGILTFYWADDYGALLQSYALKAYLSRYQKTILIPYVPWRLRTRYRVALYQENDGFWRRGYQITRTLMSRTFYHDLEAKCRMSRFRKKYLTNGLRVLSTSEDITKFGKNIHAYVAGSDQIWNPEITEGFQEGYFCTFRKGNKKGKRYIAYAASIGTESLEEQYNGPLAELLKNFDAISLREAQSVPYIKKLYDKELTVALDPVFLLGKQEWEKLLKSGRKRSEGYIALYYTEYNQEMAEYLQYLEACTGLYVLILNPKKEDYRWSKKQRYAAGCGPVEFLEQMYHAEYVVTNSFHGTAMSIIFHKQFLAFPHSTRSARLTNILRTFHLESRMPDGEGLSAQIDEKIDWIKVDMALWGEIRHSKEFIKNEILA